MESVRSLADRRGGHRQHSPHCGYDDRLSAAALDVEMNSNARAARHRFRQRFG